MLRSESPPTNNTYRKTLIKLQNIEEKLMYLTVVFQPKLVSLFPHSFLPKQNI